MAGFFVELEKESLENNFFRKVLFTASHCQLVLMALEPNQDIGMEVHGDVDQFIRIEQGTAKAILDGVEYEMKDGDAVVIPCGTQHNIVNTSVEQMLKLYTVYSPAEHADGTIHKTRGEALLAHHE